MSEPSVTDVDGEVTLDEVSELAHSGNPNFVTPEGLAAIEFALAKAQRDWTEAGARDDRKALAAIARDLRYWTSRRATAQVAPQPARNGRVQFGSTVTVRHDGCPLTFRIVGEDEADRDPATMAYTAPLAQAVLGLRAGDAAKLDGTDVEILEVA